MRSKGEDEFAKAGLEIYLAFVIKGAILLPMIFVESAAFSRRIYEVLSEAELMALERLLVIRPDSGDLIPGSGGLRKIRVASGGKGKRGGSRVIYYWYVTPEKIQLCRIYEKSSQANLSQTEINQILTELDP